MQTARRIRTGGWLCIASGVAMLLLATGFLFEDLQDCRADCRRVKGSDAVCDCVDHVNVFLSFGSASE